MNRPAFTTTLFFGCMIAASAALGGTDVVKCIDAAGHTMLTDQPCGSDSMAVALTVPAPVAAIEPMAVPADATIAAPAAAPAPARTVAVTVERYPATAQEAPRSAWADRKAPPSPSTSSDAATLRTARMALQAMDQASSQMRQHRLAGLN